MSAFIDARTVPAGTVLEPDLAIFGGGAVGIALALALAHSPISIMLFESGGMDFDAATQALYAGSQAGVKYLPLDACRMRYLGGSTNHWGGWSRPLDPIDFEKRDWVAHSGWPFGIETLRPYLPRAQSLCELGDWIYDEATPRMAALAPLLRLGEGGVYTSWFQFSKTRDDVLPTHFGTRYADDLKRIPNLRLYLHANATALKLNGNASGLESVAIATLSGRKFTVKPRTAVLAMGAIENARLMLASNVGNQNDLVGRYFADHPIPRDTATLVSFAGDIAGYYFNAGLLSATQIRATLAPTDAFKRSRKVLGSLTTIETPVEMDDLARAAVVTAAEAIGADASNAKAFSVGCGLELEPDPERRFVLTHERDALGLPRLKLINRVSDSDFLRYRETMKELGRQLLAAGTGMIRLNYDTRAEWESALDWGDHHLGTTRMHVDPKQGVVDADSKVHGLSNLFVAGSGVFPTYSASNPTLNLIALTLRLAGHLRKLPR
ncbi:MAG: GMC family oxidoreductase [Alphaproteobacteria bacterium]|nr:GMC family oxidoreductase [Alphaproteobacteria bacterium]MBL6939662.1 GMC family oxidoreductase [Alphaproteobacteria bacterium]MBL7097016.1 GMC family oxidoreductase [Alphaproteobacteria bacterium]